VRLPNLGIHYQPSADTYAKIARSELGFAEADVLYWCCQSLYKYRPKYDWIFAKIAAAVPNARFLFIRHSSDFVTGIFRERLDKVFAAEGLNAEPHCAFFNHLSFEQFMAHSAACDLFLDSPGWSGCNSALEGIATNLPIVTHRGGLMRGRHCAAILEMIGMRECIADTIDDFVAMAIRMGKDSDLRRSFQERIDRGKEAIYRDVSSVRALEHFIERTVDTLR
jgi:protein O-GlcNAc transferase